MITYERVSKVEELAQILVLQKKNMAEGLSKEELLKEGFITVDHSYDILKKMNDACPHIIAKDGDLVVGYALVMLRSFRNDIAVLKPMFAAADALLPGRNYLAMGQICIDKNYRKMGLFKGMYQYYRKELQADFECLFTEVATANKRSIGAHKSVGFATLKTQVTDGTSWELMNWDWEQTA